MHPLHVVCFLSFSAQTAFWTEAAGLTITAAGLVGSSAATLAVYVWDRMDGGQEDAVNGHTMQREFARRGKDTLALAVLATAVSMWYEPVLLRNACLTVPLTYAYSKGVGWDGVRIKTAFLGAKTLFVATLFVVWFVGAAHGLPPPTARAAAVTWLYWQTQLLSNVIADCKDIPGDRAARVRTLPVLLGYRDAVSAASCVAMSLALQAIVLLPRERVTTAYAAAMVALTALVRTQDLARALPNGLCILALQSLPLVAHAAIRAAA